MRPGNNKGHLNQNKVSNTSIHVQGSTLHMQQLMLKYMAYSSSHSVPGIYASLLSIHTVLTVMHEWLHCPEVSVHHEADQVAGNVLMVEELGYLDLMLDLP